MTLATILPSTDSKARAFLYALEQRPLREQARRDRQTARAIMASIVGRGGFDGARRDRLTEQWNPAELTPSMLHRMDVRFLRARCRDLVRNNPFARSAVRAYVVNCVERGIRPLPAIEDDETRRTVAAEWDRFAGVKISDSGLYRWCDVTGRRTFYQLTCTALYEQIVAGGCLVHYVTLPNRRRRRPVPLAIELIAEERFADDSDSFLQWRQNRKSANPIVRGVEVDAATGEPIRYWLKPRDDQDSYGGIGTGDPISIDADQCSYVADLTEIGQYRGFPLMAAVILWLWKIGYYTDNELMSSAIRSCFSAVIVSDEDDGEFGDETGLLGGSDEDDSDVDGNEFVRMQPGTVARLKKKEDIKSLSPNVPASDSLAWLQMIQQAVAIGLGLSYEAVTRDYSRGNFSTQRATANDDRRGYRVLQQSLIDHFGMPAYDRWVRSSVLAGRPGFPSPVEFANDPQAWLGVKWMAPGFPSVNPKDDAQAREIDLRLGKTTLAAECGADGNDWEEIADQRDIELAREKARRDAGLVVDQAAPQAQEQTAQGGQEQ